MADDLLNDRGSVNKGDDSHGAATLRVTPRIRLINLADQPGPGSADVQRRSVLPRGNPHVGVPEEPVLLPIASPAIRVPAVEECGLLVGIGDVGAHLGEEVQGIEDAEVRLVSRVDLL